MLAALGFATIAVFLSWLRSFLSRSVEVHIVNIDL